MTDEEQIAAHMAERQMARVLGQAVVGARLALKNQRSWSVVSERQIKAMALVVSMAFDQPQEEEPQEGQPRMDGPGENSERQDGL